jgi:FkbM family methyltransferase
MSSIVLRAKDLLKQREPDQLSADGFYIVEFERSYFAASRTNKIEAKLLRREPYDASLFFLYKAFIRPGSTCLDIGANIGVHSTIMAATVKEHGRVIAFEPVAHIRARLKRNLRLNGLSNVTVLDQAVGDTRCEMEMYQVKEGQFRAGTSTLTANENIPAMGENAFEKKLVSVTTLDDVAASHNLKVDFIKMDIEGFEYNALRGASRVLATRPVIVMEHHLTRLNYLKADIGAFRPLLKGYDVYEINPADGFGVDMSKGVALEPYNFDRTMKSTNLLCLPAD